MWKILNNQFILGIYLEHQVNTLFFEFGELYLYTVNTK